MDSRRRSGSICMPEEADFHPVPSRSMMASEPYSTIIFPSSVLTSIRTTWIADPRASLTISHPGLIPLSCSLLSFCITTRRTLCNT